MSYEIRKLNADDFLDELNEIPESPRTLYCAGTLPDPDLIRLVVVGSRKHTPYGKEVCRTLIQGLRGYPICIVSGLALGIDTIAHTTALDVGLPTIAIPGSGLSEKVLYPASNRGLAQRIIESGSCLLSEFEPEFKATVWSFPQRNRIMAGISKAVLIIEAEEKSGTLITARLATEYNRDVLAVPGSIFSECSRGTHMLLRLGATPIRDSADIIEALGLTQNETPIQNRIAFASLSTEEKMILSLLEQPLSRDVLLAQSKMNFSQFTALLSVMEIKGLIREFMGEVHKN